MQSLPFIEMHFSARADDEIAKQAAMLKEKMQDGEVKKKKGNLLGKQKKTFDSADHEIKNNEDKKVDGK